MFVGKGVQLTLTAGYRDMPLTADAGDGPRRSTLEEHVTSSTRIRSEHPNFVPRPVDRQVVNRRWVGTLDPVDVCKN